MQSPLQAKKCLGSNKMTKTIYTKDILLSTKKGCCKYCLLLIYFKNYKGDCLYV